MPICMMYAFESVAMWVFSGLATVVNCGRGIRPSVNLEIKILDGCPL